MEIKSNLGRNATRKIGLLLVAAANLGMDVGGYGVADENNTSGNVYLWIEDYPFCLFIGLGSDRIYVNYSDPETGEGYDTALGDMTLEDVYEWVSQYETHESEDE